MVKHNFHLVLTNKLKKQIFNEAKKNKISLSKAAVNIIEKTLNYFKKYYFYSNENKENYKYQKISWDCDLHIYFDEKLFNKIKHIGNTMHIFSIAIMIRKLFEFYFENINNIGKVMKKIDEKIYYYENIKKIWKKELNTEQLFSKIYYQLTFNDNYSVIGFNLTNSFD